MRFTAILMYPRLKLLSTMFSANTQPKMTTHSFNSSASGAARGCCRACTEDVVADEVDEELPRSWPQCLCCCSRALARSPSRLVVVVLAALLMIVVVDVAAEVVVEDVGEERAKVVVAVRSPNTCFGKARFLDPQGVRARGDRCGCDCSSRAVLVAHQLLPASHAF